MKSPHEEVIKNSLWKSGNFGTIGAIFITKFLVKWKATNHYIFVSLCEIFVRGGIAYRFILCIYSHNISPIIWHHNETISNKYLNKYLACNLCYNYAKNKKTIRNYATNYDKPKIKINSSYNLYHFSLMFFSFFH